MVSPGAKHSQGKGYKALSRKERRRRERAAKKARTAAYFSHGKGQSGGTAHVVTSSVGNKGQLLGKKAKKSESKPPGTLPVSPERNQKSHKGKSQTKKAVLHAANQQENREIRRLEKLLRMKRRKSKKLPASFRDEGLDYLLDLIDRDSNLSEEDTDPPHESEPEEAETKGGQKRRLEAFEGTSSKAPNPKKHKLDVTLSTTRSSTEVDQNPEKKKRRRKKVKAQNENGVSTPQSSGGKVAGSSSSVTKSILKRPLSRKLAARPTPKRVRFSLEGLPDQGSDWEEGDLYEEIEEQEEVFGLDFEEWFEREESDHSQDAVFGLVDDQPVLDLESSDKCTGDSDGSDAETKEMHMEECEGEEGEGGGSNTTGGDGSSRRGAAALLEAAEGRYVPPHLRKAATGDSQEKKARQLEKLRKKVQGLVNRLSESNMQSISSQLEQLYFENSRNDMNTTITDVLVKACVTPALLSDRLAMEHAMLVAVLHTRVGTEVGAYMVQTLAKRLDELLGDPPNYGRGKECNCVVLILAHLYNYKVIHCLLIYDIIRRLVDSFSEKDVELLLLLLKNTGMEIRRDDATSLKDIVLQIQSKAVTSSLADSSRMRFMLDTIAALKTNNARKIPNYDPSLLEHMKKLLRGLLRSTGPADEGQLKISLQDLLNAEKQGRWWVVGSAWSGRETSIGEKSGATVKMDPWVSELARKQRMSTDVRKNIFCILVTSEDCVDAFEKLLRLGLKDVQEREIIHVIVDCCLQEKEYNPYYAFLGQKFCEFKRNHQVTFQYALWDRFKVLRSLTPTNRTNLWRLCSHLVSTKALSLAVLKVVEFAELDKTEVKFYKSLLQSLLCDYSEKVCRAVFARLAPLPSLKPLRDELVVFLKHFLSSRAVSQESAHRDHTVLTNQRIRVAEQAMRTEGHLF